MSRIIRKITDFNWWYALSELVLIVAGITLALAANAWNEARLQRKEELLLLAELRDSIQADLSDVRSVMETLEKVSKNIIATIDSDEGSGNSPVWLSGQFSCTRFIQLNIRTGTYETLRNRGLNLISDDKLRQLLTSFYEDQVEPLEQGTEIHRQLVTNQLTPILADNFKRINIRMDMGGWELRDETNTKALESVVALCKLQAGSLNTYTLPILERAITTMEDLLAIIDSTLEAE